MNIGGLTCHAMREPSDEGRLLLASMALGLPNRKNYENYDPDTPWSVMNLYSSGKYRKHGYWIACVDGYPVAGAGIVEYPDRPDMAGIVVGAHRTMVLDRASLRFPIMTGYLLPTQEAYCKDQSLRYWVTSHGPNLRMWEQWQRRARRPNNGTPLEDQAREFIQRSRVLHEEFELQGVKQRIIEVS